MTKKKPTPPRDTRELALDFVPARPIRTIARPSQVVDLLAPLLDRLRGTAE